MRVRKNKNLEKVLNTSEIVIKKFPFSLKLDTIIELGSGKGEMINLLALKNPTKNYLCIEKDATIAAKSVKLFQKNNLVNVSVIVANILNLDDILQDKVKIIWLTFSDPWPKKRHANRRLTSHIFLQKYKNILAKEGIIKLKTDNDNFFDYSLKSMQDFNMKILYKTNDLHNSSKSQENAKTGYEIKWSSKGKNINYLEAKFT